ncbi:MAG TPA: class D sortase [Candidatus Eisenbacteria bacterium]|jgi:sortase A
MHRQALRWLAGGLFVSGILLLGVWVENERRARAFQAAQSKRLTAALGQAELAVRPTLGAPAGPAGTGAQEPGTGVLGRIEIPRLGISAMIAEGTDATALRHAVGHVRSTSQPGEPGNVGLAGHRDSFFRGLGEVRENDLVRIVTAHGTYDYRVKWDAVVDPHRVDVLDSTAVPSLTLVTCYPFHWVGPAPQRFVVRAEGIETTALAVR